jgi:hypothetical protein
MGTSRHNANWRIGPIPARKIEKQTPYGKNEIFMVNINAPIMLQDAVIKFWPDSKQGPCFIIEAHRENDQVQTNDEP